VGKVALGVTRQEVDIAGATVLFDPAGSPSAVEPGGVQALTSNIGNYRQDEFAVVPEVGVNVAAEVMPGLRVWAGYTFLYWSNVVRPGDQIDPALNPGLVPTDVTFGTPGGPARPLFSFKDSDFWAHGVNVGAAFRY
jgi:hypothetical protein